MSEVTPPGDEANPQLTQPEMVPEGEAAFDAAAGEPEAKSARKPAATFIFLTVMLDMLALGMIAPVLPRLIEGFLGGDASSAAKMLGLFGTIFAGMQFFFSPILGSLSDRFGRRPIVLLSNFGMGMDYLLMAWAPALPWLVVGRVISGLTASSIPTAMAYMADVTPAEKRGAAFGMLQAAFGVGFVLGPAMGGLLGPGESAAAVFGGGWAFAGERDVWTVRAAGVAGEGASGEVFLEAREPDRVDGDAVAVEAVAAAFGAAIAGVHCAEFAAERVRDLHADSLPVERADGGFIAGAGGGVHDLLRRGGGAAGDCEAGGTDVHLAGAAGRERWGMFRSRCHGRG